MIIFVVIALPLSIGNENLLNMESIELKDCSRDMILAVNDALHAMCTKWKLPIVGVLKYGRKRYNEIEKAIPNITPRMLSKELKELEMNGIVIRATHGATVEYQLTKSGESFREVLEAMIHWGLQHRDDIMRGGL